MKRFGSATLPAAMVTVLAPISWGTTYAVTTEVLPDGRPLFVALLRVVPAGLVLVAAGWWRTRWFPRRADWRRIAVLGACNFGVFFPLLFVAVYRMPGGVAAAFGGLQPLLVGTLTLVVTGRRPRSRDVAVGLVAAAGVTLVVLRPGAHIDAIGVLAAVGANLSFSLGVVLTKRFPTPVDRLATTGWQLLVGGLLLVGPAFAVEGAPPSVDGGQLLGFAYLGLVGTAAAYLLWFQGIRRLPAAAPPLLGLAAPVTGAAVGWALLAQDLSPTQLLGFALSLGAIAYGAVATTAPVITTAPTEPDPTPSPTRSRDLHPCPAP